MANLAQCVNGLHFRNPVLPAAGPNVHTGEQMLAAAEGGAGGIVAKTVSVRAASDPRPSIRRTGLGLLNCETWAEVSPREMFPELKKAKEAGLPLIVSVGYSPEEVAFLGELLEREVAPDAVEFSIHYVGKELDPLLDVAKALRRSTKIPIWMKLSPSVPDLEALAKAASPVVDAFVAINSLGPALDMDVESVSPLLGSSYGQGWLSGPPILPLALHFVYRLTTVQDKPVIGVGGIERGVDAVKFFLAGASLVQVCSAAIRQGHGVYGKIAAELDTWLDAHGYASVEEIRGLYGRRLKERNRIEGVPVMAVDRERCVACRTCLSRCVSGALYFDGSKAAVHAASCIGCGFCRDFCPAGALALRDRRGDGSGAEG
ncbi:4Fe-4S binding protein [Aminiphilus sp.]|uniref:4Fe-4S binding protein n=1 Tax=Aminiphilus sp. TaxID=1872488 RepID=UPI002607273C|nr:4Fe-4S binding protein [Aminiphilus sp.]